MQAHSWMPVEAKSVCLVATVATVATISHTHISLYREIIRLDPYQLIAFIYIYTCGYVATVATYVWNPLILPGLAVVGEVATRILKWLPVVTALKLNSKSFKIL